MEVELGRHPIPDPEGGDLSLLKIPRFLGFEPTSWSPEKFQPPSTEHNTRAVPPASFSPYNTAMTTIRWRHSPSNPKQLQSNARILRWSDGSMTLQLAADPKNQYEVGKQRTGDPSSSPQSNRNGAPAKDAYMYLGAPAEASGVIRLTNHVTSLLNVAANEDNADEAIELLHAKMAEAKQKSGLPQGNVTIVSMSGDPEEARRRAEVAEKEKAKLQRRIEAQANRERTRTERVLGARSSGFGRTTGFAADGLEGADRPRNKPKPRRQRVDYDSDEDFGRRNRTREDEYDEEDDFIAGSEEDIGGEDEEEDDDVDDDIVEDRRAAASSQKRRSEGEGSPNVSRAKKRRVVEDDDDDE
ncbi:hypothetical protein K402DRAFT_339350 [Aulographum hederae CBS 113979]|uniref:Leo1-domain-containing protein n=1 Tax=Aulographum hederae CBS 113979 TaxID=1176131 RepID=A0A6G1GQB5_9PEZI|nr:hypothetical protein K402DRAFT_339350 [Aulographum hederae CBS 113979]